MDAAAHEATMQGMLLRMLLHEGMMLGQGTVLREKTMLQRLNM